MFKQKITPLNDHKGAVYTGYVFNNNYTKIKSSIDRLISNANIPWSQKWVQYNYTSSYITTPILFFTTKGNSPTISNNLYTGSSYNNYINITEVPKYNVNTSGTYSTLVTSDGDDGGKLFISNGLSQTSRKWRTGFFNSLSEFTPRITMVTNVEGQYAKFKINRKWQL